jgi:4a-hydroxytetrahydrobiopterin dehydratase
MLCPVMATMPKALTAHEISTVLKTLRNWSGNSSGLTRTYQFADFKMAMAFMQQAAPAIDASNHHPEWSNVYNHVSVILRTHDAGNHVTELDVTLARLLDSYADALR